MLFTRKELMDFEVTDNPVSDVIVDHTRWSVVHQIVFLYKGKYWRTEYEVGATENQDMILWEYDNEVECTEVEYKKVTVGQWVPVKN